MTSFLNPYHFLPLAQSDDGIDRKDVDAALGQLKHVPGVQPLDHSSYGGNIAGELFSGRIVCRLETVGPCVFGNRHHEGKGNDWAAAVENLELHNDTGQCVPAVAATSLKGLISTLIEAASGSAFRVLENTPFSYRSNPRTEGRAAIGMIVEHRVLDDQGREQVVRGLLPLTFPKLETVSGESDPARFQILDAEPRTAWGRVLSQPSYGLTWGMYVDGYKADRNRKGNRRPHSLNQTTGFLEELEPDAHSHSNLGQLWKVRQRLPAITVDAADNAAPFVELPDVITKQASEVLHFARQGGGQRYPLTFCNSEGNAAVVPNLVTHEDDIAQLIADGWTVGILRRLSPPKNPQSENLECMGQKKHELFIPVNHLFDVSTGKFPWDDDANWDACTLLDAEDAASAFEANAEYLKDQHGDSRPFRLQGTGYGKPRLAHGDLVHFRLPDDSLNGLPHDALPPVESLAISSIWRENAADLFTFLRMAQQDELLPFSSERQTVSLAEGLFGFVESDDRSSKIDRQQSSKVDADDDDDKKYGVTALAGRLRFSAGYLDPTASGHAEDRPTDEQAYFTDGPIKMWDRDPQRRNWYPLKILASPKLPCPEMYFRTQEGASRVERSQLRKQVTGPSDDRVQPQGRKIYLHNKQAIDEAAKLPELPVWQTRHQQDSKKQKSLVRPLRPGQVFYFHVDFDNLTDRELKKLLFALSPTEEFHHKLGFGKPLGLGTVRIDPLIVCLVDRQARYREQKQLLTTGRQTRYAEVLRLQSAALDELPMRYHIERDAAQLESELVYDSWQSMHLGVEAQCVSKEIANSFTLLGDPSQLTQPVHYPRKGNRDDEAKLYEWFGAAGSQFLKPIDSHKSLDDVKLETT